MDETSDELRERRNRDVGRQAASFSLRAEGANQHAIVLS
jgi:hypothetical protein